MIFVSSKLFKLLILLGCLKDEAEIKVSVKVVFSKEDKNSSFTYKEELNIGSDFDKLHKNIEIGLKIGGRKGRKTGSAGFHFQKVMDKVSIATKFEHTKEGEYKKYKPDIYQILRKITTLVTAKLQGTETTTELVEEKYIDVFPKSEDNLSYEEWQAILEQRAIDYIKDHFEATDEQIDTSGDGATFKEAFCSLGNYIGNIDYLLL